MLAVCPGTGKDKYRPCDFRIYALPLSDDFVVRKELRNFPRRSVKRVGAVNGVFSD
jgi:hypothetical protein